MKRIDVLVSIGSVALVAALTFPWWSSVAPATAVLMLANTSVMLVGFVCGSVPEVKPVQAIFFGFSLPYLGIAPMYQVANVDASWGDSLAMLDQQRVESALGFTFVCYTVVLLAVLRGSGASVRSARPSEVDVDGRVGIACLFLGLALLLTPGVVRANGGLGGMFTSRAERAKAYAAQGISLQSEGGASFSLLSLLPVALATASCILFLVRVRRRRGRSTSGDGPVISSVVGLAVSASLVVFLANPFINSRFLTAFAVGAVVMIWLRPTRGKRAMAFATSIVIVTMAIYPLANAFRGDKMNSSGGSLWAFFGSVDFDGFQQIMNAQDLERSSGPGGNSLLSALLFFVPRSIWTEKSVPASVIVAQDRGYFFTNLSLPLHAEFLINVGYVGAVALMAVFGLLVRNLDQRWAVDARGSKWYVIAGVAGLAMLGVVRGPLGSAIPIYAPLLAFLWIGLRNSPRLSTLSGSGAANLRRPEARPGSRDQITARGLRHRTGGREGPDGPPG